MNIYIYNSSTINEYSEDDCGLILSSPIEVFDCGKITDSLIDEIVDVYLLNCCETLYPFGSIYVKSTDKVEYKKVSIEYRKFADLNSKSIILNGIIITWYGYGTLFELNNGLIRQVVPDVSGGGTVS